MCFGKLKRNFAKPIQKSIDALIHYHHFEYIDVLMMRWIEQRYRREEVEVRTTNDKSHTVIVKSTPYTIVHRAHSHPKTIFVFSLDALVE